MPLMTTFEHAVLTAQDFVYAADFDWLIEQNFIGFAVQRSRGTWQLVVGHYLGVIQLPSGMLLEVLPKIAQFSEVNLGETRAWVKTMLATIWPGLNPKALPVIAPQTSFEHAQDSIPMWLACALPVAFVILQAVLFARGAYKSGKKLGLNDKQMKKQ